VIAAVLGTSLTGLAFGWVAGMWTRKRSDAWCPVDGAKLTCPRCTTAGAHSLGSPVNVAGRASTVDGAV
jgi:hypothetical protein